MSRSAAEKSQYQGLPKATVKKMRWPYPLIWIVPIAAAAIAGWYFHDRFLENGTEIVIKFADGEGLKAGETAVSHLGVPIGKVKELQLSDDKKEVLVHVVLQRSQMSFAQKGAYFWIVRPEISTRSISGLGTVLSGPYIDAQPGNGEMQSEFEGLKSAPVATEPGLRVVLRTPKAERLPDNAPIYYRGVQVGEVEAVELSSSGDEVDVHVFIEKRFSPLVWTNSQFWLISGVDVKGGLFTGVQMKVESLRSLLSGGIGFATPDKDMGSPAADGNTFVLHEDEKKEWDEWAPKIQIQAEDSGQGSGPTSLPSAPQEIQSAVK
jgi:paraquat-inducible protein B